MGTVLPGVRARHYNKDQLRTAMRAARAHLLRQVEDLSDADWRVPYQDDINPVAWELGHIAWFAEWWTLREPYWTEPGGVVRTRQPARHAGPDELFDSGLIPHAERWTVALPGRGALYDLLAAQMEATLAALTRGGDSDAALYGYRLALFHEDMHAEAFSYLRDALGFPAPPGVSPPAAVPVDAIQVDVPAGEPWVGQDPAQGGFCFDNEKWAHRVVIPASQVDATPLSCGAFLRFVDAGGYDDPALWPAAAGRWRSGYRDAHPRWWRPSGGDWEYRWFDQWRPLALEMPLMHVNAYEAEAYCLWAGRSLLDEALWEALARQDAIRWGGVWEWLADPFTAYTGFAADPYRDYSAPWFGSHRALRGSSFATSDRICHPQYRNFYLPERQNIFAGLRTRALGR